MPWAFTIRASPCDGYQAAVDLGLMNSRYITDNDRSYGRNGLGDDVGQLPLLGIFAVWAF